MNRLLTAVTLLLLAAPVLLAPLSAGPLPAGPLSAGPLSAGPLPAGPLPAAGPIGSTGLLLAAGPRRPARPLLSARPPSPAGPRYLPPLPAFPVAYRSAAAAMRAAGCPYSSWADAGRRFLAFDAAGDGTAAEVIGDLDRADHIAVLIPGVNTSLPDFDRGLGGVARRAPAVQARALHWRLRSASPRVAVVAWLGYDTPDGIGWDAVRADRAADGAIALAAFADDLHTQRPGARITLIGHSYGAIVAGLAAPRLPYVPDVVALGAPGIGAAHAGDLGGARVWSALAAGDWIRRVPQVRILGLGHGRRPSDPAFGARALPVDGVAGHDFYLEPGSSTLTALVPVVLGAA